MFMCSFYS